MFFKLLLVPFWFVAVLLQTLYWAYLWQLKEYRFDRMVSAFREQGWRFFIPLRFFRPVFSAKAALVVFSSVVCSTVMVFYFPFWWVATPLWVAFWVGVLAIPTIAYRLYIFYKASKKLESFPNLKVVGVTGSYGKSSTKDFIATVLAVNYKTAKTPKNNNTLVGVCRAVLKLEKDTQFFVVEMGAYKRGEVAKICSLVRPSLGVITGLCPQHLSLFGSMRNLISAKLELAQAISNGGVLFLNKDDHLLNEVAKGLSQEVQWYSKGKQYALSNMAAAEKVGTYLGVSERDIVKVLSKAPFGIKTFNSSSGLIILNDSYSSNPVGFEYALSQLSQREEKNKLVVTPGIIELGTVSDEIHQKLGKKANRVATAVILTKRDFAKSFGGKLITNQRRVLDEVRKYPPRSSVVLLEGRLNQWLVQSLHN